MRKQLIHSSSAHDITATEWLQLENIAQVRITSESATNPIEGALIGDSETNDQRGWLAAAPGKQTIRLLFDHPQNIKRIHLLFKEDSEARTQEFLLRYSLDNGLTQREILRQQFTFSPPETIIQKEDYSVQIDGVTALELTLVPDINGGSSRASLASLKLA